MERKYNFKILGYDAPDLETLTKHGISQNAYLWEICAGMSISWAGGGEEYYGFCPIELYFDLRNWKNSCSKDDFSYSNEGSNVLKIERGEEDSFNVIFGEDCNSQVLIFSNNDLIEFLEFLRSTNLSIAQKFLSDENIKKNYPELFEKRK